MLFSVLVSVLMSVLVSRVSVSVSVGVSVSISVGFIVPINFVQLSWLLHTYYIRVISNVLSTSILESNI